MRRPTQRRYGSRVLAGALSRTPVLTCLGLATMACGGNAGPAAREELPPPAVEALAARSGRLPGHERVSGVVRARNQVAIRPEMSALIAEVLVTNGQAVSAGQALVRLVDDEPRERLRQAEAALMIAEAEAVGARASEREAESAVRRTRNLAAEQIVSPFELESEEARLAVVEARRAQADARVAVARAELDERRAALRRSVVRSPVSGLIGRREAEVGLLVTPGTVLFVVGDPDDLVVEVPLTVQALSVVGEGSAALIRPRDAPADPIAGRLTRISPFMQRSSFSTVGEIDVDNRTAGLWPGMFVSVDLLHGSTGEFTLIPAAAVWEDPRTGEPAAWVVTDAAGLDPAATELSSEPSFTQRRDLVLLGAGGGVAAVEGLAPGEWVVTVGQHLLHITSGDARVSPDGRVAARVRPTHWERVLEQQGLQREDLLRRFLQKQRLVSRALGATVPSDPSVVDDLVRSPPAGAERPGPAPATPLSPATAGGVGH